MTEIEHDCGEESRKWLDLSEMGWLIDPGEDISLTVKIKFCPFCGQQLQDIVFDPGKEYGRIFEFTEFNAATAEVLRRDAANTLPAGTQFNIIRKLGTGRYAWYYGPHLPDEYPGGTGFLCRSQV